MALLLLQCLVFQMHVVYTWQKNQAPLCDDSFFVWDVTGRDMFRNKPKDSQKSLEENQQANC